MATQAPPREEYRLQSLALGRVGSYAEGLSPDADPRRRMAKLVEALEVGNWIFRSIRLIEGIWRDGVLNRQIPYRAAEEWGVLAMYREWLLPHERCVEEGLLHVRRGKKPRGLAEFLANVEIAKSVASGERPPFPDPDTLARWSAAVALSRNPRPIHVDREGKVFETSGARLWTSTLDPESIKEGVADVEAGRTRPFGEVVAELGLQAIPASWPTGPSPTSRPSLARSEQKWS